MGTEVPVTSSNIYVLWHQNPFRHWSHLRQGRKDVLRQNLGVRAHCCIMENPSPLLLPKIQLPEQVGSGLVSQAVNTHRQPQHRLGRPAPAQKAQMAVLI